MPILRNYFFISIFLCFFTTANVSLAGNVAEAKAKAVYCGVCHGVKGISVESYYPNLAGQKEAYLTRTMVEYKNGRRKDPIMNAIAQTLSNDDIANLAAYYSSL